MRGGGGADILEDEERFGEAGSGNDVAYGDGGDDRIGLGLGHNEANGGNGADVLRGGDGQDTERGGAGDDILIGEGGADRLVGGLGEDRLLSSRSPQDLKPDPLHPTPIDTARDLVDCGPGTDFASANPWDVVVACEDVAYQDIVTILEPRLEGRDEWALPIRTASPGFVRLGGPGVQPFARSLYSASDAERRGSHEPFLLPLRLERPAQLQLRRVGSLRIRVAVSFKPGDSRSRVAHRTVLLGAPRASAPR